MAGFHWFLYLCLSLLDLKQSFLKKNKSEYLILKFINYRQLFTIKIESKIVYVPSLKFSHAWVTSRILHSCVIEKHKYYYVCIKFKARDYKHIEILALYIHIQKCQRKQTKKILKDQKLYRRYAILFPSYLSHGKTRIISARWVTEYFLNYLCTNVMIVHNKGRFRWGRVYFWIIVFETSL